MQQGAASHANVRAVHGEPADDPADLDVTHRADRPQRVLACLSGERAPHLDEQVRGSFTGLAAHHDRGAMTRAVVEGVVCSLADVLALLLPGDLAHTARVTGGLAQSPLVSDVLASTLSCALEHTAVDDGAAYGAALLGGVAAGVLEDADEASALPRVVKRTEPDARLEGIYRGVYERFRGLYPTPTKPAAPSATRNGLEEAGPFDHELGLTAD
jgi:xylulokinase